jgi:hypothetical protein
MDRLLTTLLLNQSGFMVGKHFLGIVLNCCRDLENSICSMDRKGTP